MLHIILLSTLAIISKSMITSHQKCGTNGYIFEPAVEACCNNDKKFNFGTQSCCNGIVFDSPSCTGVTPINTLRVQIPDGPKLIIRSDYIKPVDSEVDTVDTVDETDATDVETDDDNEDDADIDDTEDNDDDGDNDDNDDDNDDSFVEGSGDEEFESAEPGSETETGSGNDADGIGALYNQNGELESGTNNNNNSFSDMDYYVKITLINMWLILGLIVVVNIIFYWCYCRKQNRRNKMNRIQSSHMYVDEHITQGQLTDDNDDNV